MGPRPGGNGTTAIFNQASNKVLGDPGYSRASGTQIIQWDWNVGQNEQWHLDDLGNGRYAIVNAYSNEALDDPGSSTSNGTGMIQWQWNGTANQQWILMAAGDGPAVTDYVMSEGYPSSALFAPGTTLPVQQETINNGLANEEWTFVPLSNGNYLIVNAYTGLVLDDPASSTANGTNIEQYQLNGGLNQQWEVVNEGPPGGYPGLGDQYAIFNASSGMALTAGGMTEGIGTSQDGSPYPYWFQACPQEQYTGSIYQLWYLPNIDTNVSLGGND